MRLIPLITSLALIGLWAVPAHAVNCVNNIPPSNPDSAYQVHGDGTVTDTRTGIMWKQCVEGRSGPTCSHGGELTTTWAGALVHAASHSFAGHNDWRVPNLKELRSLVEECTYMPAINTDIFPNAPSSSGWSGSPAASSSNGAWYVNFYGGYAYYNFRDFSYGVRLARGGQ